MNTPVVRNTDVTKSDYNNYYTVGSRFVSWAGGDRENLNALRAINGGDAFSYNINPHFTAYDDLRLLFPDLSDKAEPLMNISTDIFDTRRPSGALKPCIGAHEYPRCANDIAITKITVDNADDICDGDQINLRITVMNYGTSQVRASDGIIIAAHIKGAVSTTNSIPLTATIPPMFEATMPVLTLSIPYGMIYDTTVIAYAIFPTDTCNKDNDTITLKLDMKPAFDWVIDSFVDGTKQKCELTCETVKVKMKNSQIVSRQLIPDVQVSLSTFSA